MQHLPSQGREIKKETYRFFTKMNEQWRLHKDKFVSGCSMEEWASDLKEVESRSRLIFGLFCVVEVTVKSHPTRGGYVLKTTQNHI
jgi:hypothetical protein